MRCVVTVVKLGDRLCGYNGWALQNGVHKDGEVRCCLGLMVWSLLSRSTLAVERYRLFGETVSQHVR